MALPYKHDVIKGLLTKLCDEVVNKSASGMMTTHMINMAMNLKRDAGRYFKTVEDELGSEQRADAQADTGQDVPAHAEPPSQEQVEGLLGVGDAERIPPP